MVILKDLKRLFYIVLFKIILEISYVKLLNPIWGYMGFNINIDYFKLVESYILLLIIYSIIPKTEQKLSNIFIQFLFLMMIIPTLSLYAMKNETRFFMYLITVGFIITIITVRIFPKIKIVKLKIPKKGLFAVLTLLSLTTYSLLIKDNGIPSFQAFNLLNVYIVRSNFKTSLDIIKYFMMWQAKIINPFFIGVFLSNRDYKKFTFIIALQLILFLMTGHKSFLFAILLVIGVFYLVEKKKFFNTFSFGLLVINFLAMMFGVLNITIYPTLFIINRVFFVPAQNYFYYYNFFSQNPLVYLSQSLIGKILHISTQYNMNITYMMGDIYYGSSRIMVNTGYLSDAYMNFGILGVVLFSVLLGCIFILIDQISKNIRLSVAITPFIFPIFSLIDGALLTTLLTHGLILSFLIIYVSNNEQIDGHSRYSKNKYIKHRITLL